MSGISYSYGGGGSAPDLTPDQDAAFIDYATEVGGEYFKQLPSRGIVVTKADNWTIVAEGGSQWPNLMRALYRSLDGFQFKVATKWGLHDFMARIFGSKDIDIGEHELQERYSVEARNTWSDEHMVRKLLTNQTFRDVWSRCVHPAGPKNVIDRFEAKQYKDAHEIEVQILHVWGLSFVHDLVVHTLRELADMGSASTEPVVDPLAMVEGTGKEFPLGGIRTGGWKPFVKDAEHEAAWRKAEEQHFQKGSELGDEGKWQEAIHYFGAALRLNPSHSNAHAQRGFAYAETGQRDEAIADLERAKALTDDPDIVADLVAAIVAIRERR